MGLGEIIRVCSEANQAEIVRYISNVQISPIQLSILQSMTRKEVYDLVLKIKEKRVTDLLSERYDPATAIIWSDIEPSNRLLNLALKNGDLVSSQKLLAYTDEESLELLVEVDATELLPQVCHLYSRSTLLKLMGIISCKAATILLKNNSESQVEYLEQAIRCSNSRVVDYLIVSLNSNLNYDRLYSLLETNDHETFLVLLHHSRYIPLFFIAKHLENREWYYISYFIRFKMLNVKQIHQILVSCPEDLVNLLIDFYPDYVEIPSLVRRNLVDCMEKMINKGFIPSRSDYILICQLKLRKMLILLDRYNIMYTIKAETTSDFLIRKYLNKLKEIDDVVKEMTSLSEQEQQED